jgi:hypothetical protein
MRLQNLCNQISCDPRDALLILDCGPVFLSNEANEEEFTDHLISAINQLPNLYEWGQITLVANSLGDVQKIKSHEEKLVRRAEWFVYMKLLARRAELYRLPVFSDYGTDYRESLTPIKARPSAKLNYTTEEAHFIVKGANVKVAGYEAIYPVAEKLVSSGHYYGERFSVGDARIWLLSQRRSSTGNAPIWRWACADHHLVVVGKALMRVLGVPMAEPATLIDAPQQELFSVVPAK